ncbi:hypothetical protein SDC9_138507 [bioreactor metagenome]|uniref:YokE-like PH domain-containing protein n=1 Tax=bioreactor metagenome TaxID=1076179 RepID=A0A645DQ55_9ZZZZ
MFGIGGKEKKPKLTQKEIAMNQAANLFKDSLTGNEKILHAVSGKCDAENFIFSIGILGETDKRILYYFQDGSKTGTETVLYDKIISITSISGFEKKMGNYIGVSIELANGKQRVVRCIVNDENKELINEIILFAEGKR